MAIKVLADLDVQGNMNITASDVPNLSADKITSGTFNVARIPDDLRGGQTRIGKDSSNYISIDYDNNNVIDFFISGTWVARIEADGDLHMKGDVIAVSDIFNP